MASAYPRRTLREITRVIFSRMAGIILILAVVAGSVLAATYLAPWRYRSRALLLARMGKIHPLETPAGVQERLRSFIVTQRELIKSDYVLASALMELDGVQPGGAKGGAGAQRYGDEQVRQFIAAHPRQMSDARRRVRVQTHTGPGSTVGQTFELLVTWPEQRELAWRSAPDSMFSAWIF